MPMDWRDIHRKVMEQSRSYPGLSGELQKSTRHHREDNWCATANITRPVLQSYVSKTSWGHAYVMS